MSGIIQAAAAPQGLANKIQWNALATPFTATGTGFSTTVDVGSAARRSLIFIPVGYIAGSAGTTDPITSSITVNINGAGGWWAYQWTLNSTNRISALFLFHNGQSGNSVSVSLSGAPVSGTWEVGGAFSVYDTTLTASDIGVTNSPYYFGNTTGSFTTPALTAGDTIVVASTDFTANTNTWTGPVTKFYDGTRLSVAAGRPAVAGAATGTVSGNTLRNTVGFHMR